LAQHGVRGLGFKWPNDIHVNARKAAGILLETRSQAFGVSNVVIGIGINLKVAGSVMAEVDQPWGAIADSGFDLSRRNEFSGNLINQLIELIEEFKNRGLAHYKMELARFDLLKGKDVSLSSGQKSVSGVAVGIDDAGKLIIRSGSVIRFFSSAEVVLSRLSSTGVVDADS
jgi:BirA family biotin operon repressor/biotin-[acetyl-CoA-carboxylase] ligase